MKPDLYKAHWEIGKNTSTMRIFENYRIKFADNCRVSISYVREPDGVPNPMEYGRIVDRYSSTNDQKIEIDGETFYYRPPQSGLQHEKMFALIAFQQGHWSVFSCSVGIHIDNVLHWKLDSQNEHGHKNMFPSFYTKKDLVKPLQKTLDELWDNYMIPELGKRITRLQTIAESIYEGSK